MMHGHIKVASALTVGKKMVASVAVLVKLFAIFWQISEYFLVI